jgi:hypothetical protein
MPWCELNIEWGSLVITDGWPAYNGLTKLDVAVTTHKTIDLVFSTQVFKLKRDMQKHSRTATASATLCQNGVAEVTHEQSAHSPATRCNRSVTAGAPPAGAQDHSRTVGEDQCQ